MEKTWGQIKITAKNATNDFAINVHMNITSKFAKDIQRILVLYVKRSSLLLMEDGDIRVR
jgi:hypothetical protein